LFSFLLLHHPLTYFSLFPYTSLFRSLDDFTRLTLGADEENATLVRCQLTHVFQRIFEHRQGFFQVDDMNLVAVAEDERCHFRVPDRKSTRLNSSHVKISYAVFCLKLK